MATKQLTPKQTQVKNLLDGGQTVAQVAKRMKISEGGVHGHVRKIRAAGYEVSTNAHQAQAAPAPEPAPPITSNGHHVDDEVEALIRHKLAEGKARLGEIEDRVREMDDEVANLRNEQSEINAQQDKYAKVLEDLA